MQRVVWLLAVALLVAACTGQGESAAPAAGPGDATMLPSGLEPSEPFDVTTVTLTDAEGGSALAIEVFDAHTSALRQRGLMERT